MAKKISFEPIKDIETNSKVIAEFFKVYKEFKENNKTLSILNGFNLRIKRGDRIGIIGPNGTGKTTFLRLILNDLKADKGSIKINKKLGIVGFEPTTPCSQSRCSTKLSYIPKLTEELR